MSEDRSTRDLPPILRRTRGYRDPEDAEERGVYPFFRALEEVGVTRVRVDGHIRIMAGSNNYLGLTHHPRVVEANRDATRRFGTGLTGSRLLNGTMELHLELEERLAAFYRKEDAIVFPAGYLANIGTVPALAGRGDHLLLDRFVHASVMDAARLSGARVHRFPHRDLETLGSLLRERPPGADALVITEGVFSMDGDVADLAGICALARPHGAAVLVDDAHGLGVLGKRGAGTAEAQGVEGEVDLVMATFSKSLGSVGGVVVGPKPVIHYLRHHARAFLFTASLPPGTAAGVLVALEILESEPERRARLARSSDRLRSGLRGMGFSVLGEGTPVIPVVVGGGWWPTLAAWRALFDQGVFVNAVLPPAVERNSARLRVSVTSEHSDEEVDRILEAFSALTKTRPESASAPAMNEAG
ncbi:MAG: pyridoxal phosphate-dependent aminotransferase family protein [Gemmatimonadetes bacterium]|nr:pyridoxal phosphate-dependent aminotransferase family protein [Gemmatimonadota bacterium]